VLIGADGVRSRVREAMSSQLPPGRFESELRLMPGRWQVLHMQLPPAFQQDSVHAMVNSKAPFGLFCIPNNAGPHCVIVSWSSDEDPWELLAAHEPEELQAVLLKYFPQLGEVPREAAQLFLDTRPSKAVASRCRPLHDVDASVCVLGDAAHAVGGGSLGQGCSAALQDAAELAACFRQRESLLSALKQGTNGALERPGEAFSWTREEDEALASTLAAYSERRAAEGWALLDLIELQSAAEVRAGALVQAPVVMGFFLEQLGRGTLRPLAEIGSRLVQNRLEVNVTTEKDLGVLGDIVEPKLPFLFDLTPSKLAFLIERQLLGFLKVLSDGLASVAPSMQTSLMATGEAYSQIVERNKPWLALLRSAKAAAGMSLLSSVRAVKALGCLNDSQGAEWAAKFSSQERLKDDVIVRQSSTGTSFFAIRAGSCKVRSNGVEVAELGPGDSFGEVALLLGVVSPVSVVAATDVTLLVMKDEVFLELAEAGGPELRTSLAAPADRYGAGIATLEAQQQEVRSRVKSLLPGWNWVGESDTAVGSAGTLEFDRLMGTVGSELYSRGNVVALGCQRLRVVEHGQCSVARGGRKVREIREGDFFGPEVASNERVVADSDEVRICSFDDNASLRILANMLEVDGLMGHLAPF